VLGIATHPEFDRYELGFSREPARDDTWVFIMDNHTQVTQIGLPGTWDTNTVPDGIYALRLRVIRRDGNYDEVVIHNLTVANAEPTPTPTPEGTPTPTPTPTASPTPRQLTPTIFIEQPQPETPTPPPRRTEIPASPLQNGSEGETRTGSGQGGTINLRDLVSVFVYGALLALGAFLAAGFLFAARGLLVWLWKGGLGRRNK
jgi:hypothetical protein